MLAARSRGIQHADFLEEEAIRLLAVARTLNGVACERCGGAGQRAYGDTSTWRGGCGGQMIAVAVCDLCWGTGRSDRSGPNLRKISSLLPK